MSDTSTTQPTILVKKSDGTSERITLTEFRARMRTSADTADSVSPTQSTDTVADTPASVRAVPAPSPVVSDDMDDEVVISTVKRVSPPVDTPRMIPLSVPIPLREKVKSKREKGKKENSNFKIQNTKFENEKKLKIQNSKVESGKSKVESREHFKVKGKKWEKIQDLNVSAPIVSSEGEGEYLLPALETPHELSNTTPVTHIFEYPTITRDVPVADIAAIPTSSDIPSSVRTTAQAPDDEHRSLLDEDFDEVHAMSREKEHVSDTHAPVRSVVFAQSVNIPSELSGRAESLILSWKKGVRDDHAFMAYAMRPVEQGGLGLSQGDAEQLFAEVSHHAVLGPPAAPPPRPVAPSTTSRPTPVSMGTKSMHTMSTPASAVLDVAPATKPAVMGPKEEMASFTLEDFRRLSQTPSVASDMLRAKCAGWKEESYLLYLSIRDAWRESPLYRTYTQIVVQSLNQNIPFDTTLAEHGYTRDEFEAIASFNRALTNLV